jgi:peptidoglycan/xylan/chitin deacetylase (PgdA/CDA1 family)
MNIYLSFDFDYPKDYDNLPNIYDAIGDTPVTFFLAGSRHPEIKYDFPVNVELGNHSYHHQEWYEKPLQDRIIDLMQNHEWLRDTYGVEAKVYRSPHLRNFKDMADEMEKHGYQREMECAECSVCNPMEHAHLKQYFSSFHHFRHKYCPLSFIDNFERICQKDKDFTFFLDSHDFDTEEKLSQLKELIKIGNKYGKFKHLSEHQG